jgi:selenocysteine lyase/cysteine desulfurase
METESVASARDRFDLPDDVCYLNCAYMSPLLKAVRDAGHRGVERKATPWRIAPSDFFEEAEEARGLFAALIGAEADDIALTTSAGYGLAVAALNAPLGPGQTVVLMADEFPAAYYTWKAAADRAGATLRIANKESSQSWTDALLAAIDSSVRVVSVSPCHWTDGEPVALAPLRARCDEVGALLVLDATQWVGAAPFSVAELRPDYVAVATYKWLLGPYSFGFLYVAPRHQDGRPLDESWINRAGSDDFRRLTNYEAGYRPGARRFDLGEPSNFILLPMVIAALRQLLAWDVGAISAGLRRITSSIAEQLRAANVAPERLTSGSPHIVGLTLAPPIEEGLGAWFAERRIYVSLRGTKMRIAPHLYVRPADVERFVAAVVEAGLV